MFNGAKCPSLTYFLLDTYHTARQKVLKQWLQGKQREVLQSCWRGYPSPVLLRGAPQSFLVQVVYQSCLGWKGVPWNRVFPITLGYSPPGTGIPPPQKEHGISNWGAPQKGRGTRGSSMGWRWVPPSWTDTHLFLRMRAVTRNSIS